MISKMAGQPYHQGLSSIQNGGLEKILANSRSRVSKSIGDFDCFKLAAGFVRTQDLLFARVFSKPPF